jgi:hypothetical protein
VLDILFFVAYSISREQDTRGTTMMATFNLTWVERGTNNAAMLGHDEKGLVGDSEADVMADVLHHAEECGIDLDRYEPVLDEVDAR